MKYVIDCTPDQIRIIRRFVEEIEHELTMDKIMGRKPRIDEDIDEVAETLEALENTRNLSELCEEEAKRYDRDAEEIKRVHTYTNGAVSGVWDSVHRMEECDKVETIAQAIRSFGSK